MLIDKNRKYGNSALEPIRVFSQADPAEQLRVRIDDKLSRIIRGHLKDDEDVIQDLLGYLILLRVHQELSKDILLEDLKAIRDKCEDKEVSAAVASLLEAPDDMQGMDPGVPAAALADDLLSITEVLQSGGKTKARVTTELGLEALKVVYNVLGTKATKH